MDRRNFLRFSGAASAGLALPASISRAFAQANDAGWKIYEVVHRVEVLKPAGVTRIWLPTPLTDDTGYHKSLGTRWNAESGTATYSEDAKYGAGIVAAEFAPGVRPVLSMTSRFATRNRAVDFSRRNPAIKLDAATAKFAVAPTELIPTDGIVRKTAYEITRGKSSDIQKARAIYDWIVDNTQRNPKTRGCGVGDIKSMLETGDLSGKCADLNALYVGLARAVNLPARDVYGLRVARSEFGYRSLGAGSPNVTRAQHCRAEVYLVGYGWVPVDPADVRKVVLEEKPQPTTLADPVVPPVRAKLFGAWEMNWLAYNEAHDVRLPGSQGPAVGFLMYPQAETAKGRFDELDPDNFKYTITARELKT